MSSLRTETTDRVALITISRPEKLNALDESVVNALLSTFTELSLAGEAAPRAAIITGEGKAFCAGADIAAMATMPPARAKRFADLGHRLGALIESLDFPVIAAVNGAALGGGCELALACDFIYASDKAKFGQPEVKLGVIPGFGGTQRLARRVGIGKARELCYTGDIINAEEALRIGLTNAVVAADELLAKSKEVAMKIASVGPLAIAAAKRVMVRGEDQSLASANELEAQAFAQLFGSEDQKSGMRAFIEKTPATFTGK
jgi:enoyl-CoA hydratase